MKKIIFVAMAVLCMDCHCLWSQNEFYADFETFNTTPYFYRFGNNTNVNYYPRWQYSHEVVDNPLVNGENPSAKVLRYTSLEARGYGLKILFPAPLNVEDIDTIRFRIYQPQNVIGKPVDGAYSAASATSQEIRVKLLTAFNTIKDQKEDVGVVLTFSGSVLPFSSAGDWVDYRLPFSVSKLSQADQNKLLTGILGIAILPTYGAGVTLQSQHVCYIDDIAVKGSQSGSGISRNKIDHRQFTVHSGNQKITVRPETEGEAGIRLFDLRGALMYDFGTSLLKEKEICEYSVHLLPGAYIVSVLREGKYYNYKVVIVE